MSRPGRSFWPGLSLLVFFALVGALVGAASSGNAYAAGPAVVDPDLSAALDQQVGPFEVIVTFHGSEAPGAVEVALLQQLGIAQGLTFQALPMVGVLATADQVRALATKPAVRSLWLNETLQYENDGATLITRVDKVRADGGMTNRNGGMPVSGYGSSILVNDSGVDGLHPDLGSRVVQNVAGQAGLLSNITGIVPRVYVEGVDHTDIAGGHGTHVAAIAAGTGGASDGKYEGVAPGAKIVSFSSGLGLSLLNVLGGFDYGLQNRERYAIRVITNSWGSTSDRGDFNPDHPTNVASKLINDVGVVVVFSAGNSGPNAGTITGNYKKAPWVITVAAGDKSGALANFSSRGVKDKTVVVTGSDGTTYVSEDRPTVTAPGVRIVSARASGSSLSGISAINDALGIAPEHLVHYTTLSGTSMAAPHVAGIVGLMLDANPALTPAQVKALIQETANPMAGYELWEVGAGYVDAYDAVAAAFAPGGPPKCNLLNQCLSKEPRVTVAVIDSGINPYHSFFRAGGEPYQTGAPSSVSTDVLEAFGIDDDHIIDLTITGNFDADYEADKVRVWDKINQGELYWFRGTNIIAVSYRPGTRPIMPDSDSNSHGVGTAAAVLGANPDAIVVFVEGITDDSEAFAFNHPQVDIITTSYGPIGSIPLPWHLTNSYLGVVNNGKLHFGAADNSPSTATQDSTAGPWWSIGIAGFQEESTEGRQMMSGSLPDFVGDFTQTLPYCANCESGTRTVSGTSFATPRSAGTMSRIVLEARRAYKHEGGIETVNGIPMMVAGKHHTLSNWQFRRALEEAAYYPSVYDYGAGGASTWDYASVPVLDPAPWAQVGWGAITPDVEHDVISQTLAHLGVKGEVTRVKDPLACQYMTAQIEARHAYWDKLVVDSESLGELNDPYIYCGR